MHLRDAQAQIVVSCPSCGVRGELPLSAIRQRFLCTECGTEQTLGEERAKAIEEAIAEAIQKGAKRIAEGEERVRVEIEAQRPKP